ncbi:MAG: protein phosphatase 2C domain-containing protein [Anaerolineae bacterium]
MGLISAQQSDPGRGAKHNEDFIWVDEPAGIYIVADGMGGQEAGELASHLAATTTGQYILARLNDSHYHPKTLIVEAIEAANAEVMTAAQTAQQDRPMGAAIVAVLLRLPAAYICHAGDARAYLVHNSVLTRLTVDDSWVAQLLASGVISEEQARKHPLGNILTKAVGHESPLEPACTEITLAPGDWFLLCSDGLWKMVPDEQIQAEIEKSGSSPASVVETLIQAANTAGGEDNISLLVVKVST